jgi:hypothetical protein
MTDFDVPRLKMPLRYVGGRAELVEQDSDDEVAQCAEAIVRTPIGHRLDLPDFGIDDQAFRENGADLPGIGGAIERYEPRARTLLDRPGAIEDLVDRIVITTTAGAR